MACLFRARATRLTRNRADDPDLCPLLINKNKHFVDLLWTLEAEDVEEEDDEGESEDEFESEEGAGGSGGDRTNGIGRNSDLSKLSHLSVAFGFSTLFLPGIPDDL